MLDVLFPGIFLWLLWAVGTGLIAAALIEWGMGRGGSDDS